MDKENYKGKTVTAKIALWVKSTVYINLSQIHG